MPPRSWKPIRSRGPGRTACLFVIIALGAGRTSAGEFDWRTSSPEDQGISSARLEDLWSGLKARGTTGWLLIRNDRIVMERYADGWNASRPHYTASMAKALVGGVATSVALNDGRLRLDDRAADHVPAWKDDPRRSRITIRELGSHTSGLEDAEEAGKPHSALTGWKGVFWTYENPPRDPFTIARDETPLLFDPGARFQYSNPGIAMLSYTVTSALKGSADPELRSLLRNRVMRPIGVPDREWSIGYGKTTTVDGLPLVAPWGGGAYTARAVARVARLMLRQGDWEGTRLISVEAVRQVVGDAGTPGSAGIGWWSNHDGSRRSLPRDAFLGSGAGHQVVLVIPSLKLIAVRNGQTLDPKQGHEEALETCLFAPLIDAINDR